MESLTDRFTGVFTLQDNALKTNVESLSTRIEELDARLELRRDRLIRQFAAMEESLSSIQSQQDALLGLQNLQS
jgi:flagellar hook-associated protein 2